MKTLENNLNIEATVNSQGMSLEDAAAFCAEYARQVEEVFHRKFNRSPNLKLLEDQRELQDNDQLNPCKYMHAAGGTAELTKNAPTYLDLGHTLLCDHLRRELGPCVPQRELLDTLIKAFVGRFYYYRTDEEINFRIGLLEELRKVNDLPSYIVHIEAALKEVCKACDKLHPIPEVRWTSFSFPFIPRQGFSLPTDPLLNPSLIIAEGKDMLRKPCRGTLASIERAQQEKVSTAIIDTFLEEFAVLRKIYVKSLW